MQSPGGDNNGTDEDGFYVVKDGSSPGIFRKRHHAEEVARLFDASGFQRFASEEEARQALDLGAEDHHYQHQHQHDPPVHLKRERLSPEEEHPRSSSSSACLPPPHRRSRQEGEMAATTWLLSRYSRTTDDTLLAYHHGASSGTPPPRSRSSSSTPCTPISFRGGGYVRGSPGQGPLRPFGVTTEAVYERGDDEDEGIAVYPGMCRHGSGAVRRLEEETTREDDLSSPHHDGDDEDLSPTQIAPYLRDFKNGNTSGGALPPPLPPALQPPLPWHEQPDIGFPRSMHELERFVAAAEPGVTLHPRQWDALQEFLFRRRNIFVTGPGGVGKSLVTRFLISALNKKYGSNFPRRVAVTAPTGIAAINVGGCTIHSATGVGVPNTWADFGRLFDYSKTRKYLWRDMEVLVVDEVSMMSGEWLDALDKVLRDHRGKGRGAFGGIQVALIGDFAQLPPITEKLPFHLKTMIKHGQEEDGQVVWWEASRRQSRGLRKHEVFTNRGYAFTSRAWWDLDLLVVELSKVYRQKEQDFIDRLNRMRMGTVASLTPQDVQYFNTHHYDSSRMRLPGAAEPLHLYALNREVDRLNRDEMDALPGSSEFYACHDAVELLPPAEGVSGVLLRSREETATLDNVDDREEGFLLWEQRYFDDVLAKPNLELRVGCKVLLIRNLDMGRSGRANGVPLVNGSAGKLVGWASEEEVRRRLAAIRGRYAQPNDDDVASGQQQQQRARPPPPRVLQHQHQHLHQSYTAAAALRAAEDGGGRSQDAVVVPTAGSPPLHVPPPSPPPVSCHPTGFYTAAAALAAATGSTTASPIPPPSPIAGEEQQIEVELVPPTPPSPLSPGPLDSQQPAPPPLPPMQVTQEEDERDGAGEEEDDDYRPQTSLPSYAAYHMEVLTQWVKDNKDRVPLVEFHRGGQSRVEAMLPELFSSTITGLGRCYRVQVPLVVAFGISIHKSQGMTLDEACIGLAHVFEDGQAYVAISRVGPRSGLHLLDAMQSRMIKVNKQVSAWYRAHQEVRHWQQQVLQHYPVPSRRREVEGLGLRSLLSMAEDYMHQRRAPPPGTVGDAAELRRKWTAVRNALLKLRPVEDWERGHLGSSTSVVFWGCISPTFQAERHPGREARRWALT